MNTIVNPVLSPEGFLKEQTVFSGCEPHVILFFPLLEGYALGIYRTLKKTRKMKETLVAETVRRDTTNRGVRYSTMKQSCIIFSV